MQSKLSKVLIPDKLSVSRAHRCDSHQVAIIENVEDAQQTVVIQFVEDIADVWFQRNRADGVGNLERYVNKNELEIETKIIKRNLP